MKRLTLGTLVALVASAIFVAPGGAGKPAYTITCNPTTTTLTWKAGTASYSGAFAFDDAPSLLFVNNPAIPLGNGPGSLSFDTPFEAHRVDVVFVPKKGQQTTASDDNCLS